ncbi:Peptidyl-prolyl cis-trans isomerase-like 1 [Aphanomyces cochlioides]|nr:Peptidyl-prolyl cis-trans isomerase-like 1 [Aphanomyces cochlioides]
MTDEENTTPLLKQDSSDGKSGVATSNLSNDVTPIPVADKLQSSQSLSAEPEVSDSKEVQEVSNHEANVCIGEHNDDKTKADTAGKGLATNPGASLNEINTTNAIQKRVRFADEKPVTPSFMARRIHFKSAKTTTARRFPWTKVVVSPPPVNDNDAMAMELAFKLPPDPPLLTFKEHLSLGMYWSKRVKLLRRNDNQSPLTLKIGKKKLDVKQWTIVMTMAFAYNTTLMDLDVQGAGIDSMAAKTLFQAVRANHTLLTLNASKNHICDDAMFALAAMAQTNTTLTRLSLHANMITSKGMKLLGHALEENQDSMLLDLDLSLNPLGEGSTEVFCNCLQINETLTALNLANTNVHEAGVLAALRRNYTLVSLQLQTIPPVKESNQSGQLPRDRLNRSHAPPLMDALRRSTCALEECNLTGVTLPISKFKMSRWVKLPHFSLNELDGMIISALLPANKHLLELDLSHNALGSESVIAIVAAIIECPTLKTVEIQDNDVTDISGEAIGLALANNTTLETICVAVSTLDIQQLRGNDTSEFLTLSKDLFAHPLDNWIVTVLMGVNRRTQVLNDLHVPPLDAHLDLCHLTLQVYEAVYICTRVRHHVHMTHLVINSSHLDYYAGMRLADAIRNHSILKFVSLEHNNLHQMGGKAIAEAMEHNTSITYLNLSWNQLDDAGVQPFATSLSANRCLKRLDLRGNSIGASGIAAISQGLAGNGCLEELFLRWNDIGPNAAISLANALCINKTLSVLDIEQQHMETQGAFAMAAMLCKNKSLKSLNMKGDLKLYPTSGIGMHGAERLAAALRDNNQTLTHLNVSETRMKADGCEYFAQVMTTLHLKKLDLAFVELNGETSLVLFAQLAHNTTLVEFNASHNTIGADGIKGCVRCLCVNKTLREVDLSFNQITEEGMLLIEAQAKQFSLNRLRLLGNRVTDGTRERLASMQLSLVIDI